MSSAEKLSVRPARLGAFRRLGRWLDALPHPSIVLEIAATHVAAARWGRGAARLLSYAAEALPAGAVKPSATQANIETAETVSAAVRRVMARVPAHGQEIALLVPDPVIRIFILPFDTFPRRAEEALPLLRWRLKKSLPFDAEEAVISWMRQAGREGKPEIVAAVARQKILREYEQLAEAEGMIPGVVASSTLAALPLVDGAEATLLLRSCGNTLTSAIVRGETLCVYRSTELAAGAASVSPPALLEEIYPAIAFYQDTWGGSLGGLRMAGFGDREEEFRQVLAAELGSSAAPLAAGREFPAEVKSLLAEKLDALVGWQMNRGA